MSYQVINPFIQFVDPINGKPLSGGSVYFGRQDTDPKNQPSNRINVYAVQDNGTEVLLAQPITLNGAGQPQYSGSVKQIKVELYAGENAYCVQVFNSNGSQKGYSARVYSLVDVAGFTSQLEASSPFGTAMSLVVGKSNFFVTPEQFGAVGNGTTNDSAAIKLWLETPLKKVAKYGAVYNLGTLSGDAALATTNGVNHDIDFNFCKIVCAGQTGATYTDTTMFKIVNGTLSVRNLAGFNDTSFSGRGAGRGVAPWIIQNSGVDTHGYYFENIILDTCQSFGTFFSNDPTYQARGIEFGEGCVIKGDCERGLTLSESGSNIGGEYKITGTVNRCLFAKNVSNIDLDIYGGSAQPSSGNLLLVCSDNKTVQNVRIRLMNSLIYAVSVVANGAGSVFKNLDIDVWSDSIGDVNTEVIRFGAQDLAGNWQSAVNFTATDINFRIRSSIKNFIEFGMQTLSTNVDPISLDTFGNYSVYNQGFKTYFLANGQYYRAENLPTVAATNAVDTSKFQKNISNIAFEVFVKGSGGGVQVDCKFIVTAFKDSSGNLNSFNSVAVYTLLVGGGGCSLSASGSSIVATYSGFAGSILSVVAVRKMDY